jgi:hypothetical protein
LAVLSHSGMCVWGERPPQSPHPPTPTPSPIPTPVKRLGRVAALLRMASAAANSTSPVAPHGRGDRHDGVLAGPLLTSNATSTTARWPRFCCDWPLLMGVLAVLAVATPVPASAPTNTPATPAACFRRKITNATSLRFMHVTQDMADCLGLRGDRLERMRTHGAGTHGACDVAHGGDVVPASALVELAHSVKASPSRASGDCQPNKGGCPTPLALKSIHRLFRCLLTLRDSAGQDWPVLYEATLSCNQYHRRLSHGWRDFCCKRGVQVGDVVEFRRRPMLDEHTLAVRVVKRGG